MVSIYIYSLIFLLLLVSIFFLPFESKQLCELYILLLKLCSICIRSRIYHCGELLSFNFLGCTTLSFSDNYLDVWKEKSNLFMRWTLSKNLGTFYVVSTKGFLAKIVCIVLLVIYLGPICFYLYIFLLFLFNRSNVIYNFPLMFKSYATLQDNWAKNIVYTRY